MLYERDMPVMDAGGLGTWYLVSHVLAASIIKYA